VRRLGRILLNTFTALSFVLFLAICVLWVRSLTRRSVVTWSERAGSRAVAHSVRSIAGTVGFARHVYEYGPYPDPIYGDSVRISTHDVESQPMRLEEWHFPLRLLSRVSALSEGEPAVSYQSVSPNPLFQLQGGFTVSIRYWIPALITAAFPLAWGMTRARGRWHRRRQSTRDLGRCASCGYDLRATPGRCPECGAVPGPAGPADGRPGGMRA
jgi:hypothetical protein